MTRDLFPLIVIDRAMDLIFQGALRYCTTEEQRAENKAFCNSYGSELKVAPTVTDWLKQGFDLGIPVELAAEALADRTAIEYAKLLLEQRGAATLQ